MFKIGVISFKTKLEKNWTNSHRQNVNKMCQIRIREEK